MPESLRPGAVRRPRTRTRPPERRAGRWRVRSLALIAATCVLAAGCQGTPEKQDPKATKEPAKVKVGDCFAAGAARPVDCRSPHVAQAVYVSHRPFEDTATALKPCRRAQASFLGQDFNTRLDVQLWVARDESWYRCDVMLRNSTRGQQGYQVLTGSLKGVLRRGAAVRLRACLDARYDPSVDQAYVPCTSTHVSRELTVAPAIGTLDEEYPSDVAERATKACNATAAAGGELVTGREVRAFYPQNAQAWDSGERTADCWVIATRGRLPGVQGRR